MPKPRDSMYSESIYSQSSWAPSITPSFLDKFPTPPGEEGNVPPVPVIDSRKLAAIVEEQADMRRKKIEPSSKLTVPSTTANMRRRSASFSGLTKMQFGALKDVDMVMSKGDALSSIAHHSNTGGRSNVQAHSIGKSKSRSKSSTAHTKYAGEETLLHGMMRRHVQIAVQPNSHAKLTKNRSPLPRTPTSAPAPSAGIHFATDASPSSKFRHVSQPTIRSGNRLPITLNHSHLRPNDIKYATTQERIRGVAGSGLPYDQHGLLRARRGDSSMLSSFSEVIVSDLVTAGAGVGSDLDQKTADAMARFMREKNLTLEIQKAKVRFEDASSYIWFTHNHPDSPSNILRPHLHPRTIRRARRTIPSSRSGYEVDQRSQASDY